MESPGFGCVDSGALPSYDLGVDHPFARDRQVPLADLLRRMDLVQPGELLRPPSAAREELEMAHDGAYLDMVEATSVPNPSPAVRAAGLSFGLGTADNPLAPGQHQAASAVAGATADCVRRVVEGTLRHAFNATGGLHHASARAASGFCIYNDLVVGIKTARAMGLSRVMYVDFDVHHGDGVEFAFDEDATVLTVSFHQSPETLFPGTGRVNDVGRGEGRGTVVNMPFAPYTGDASWWHCVSNVLPAVARRFDPDMILSQHGCDPHREDPLAQLQLTTEPMGQAARLCRELADELCEGRWVATGGGGYQPYRVIPRAWTMVWLELCGRQVPERLDPEWIAAWQHASDAPLTPTFLDPPMAAPNALENEAHELNLRCLEELVALHGL